MGKVGDRWNAMSSRFARLLPSRRRFSEGAQPASRILAIVPQGPNRLSCPGDITGRRLDLDALRHLAGHHPRAKRRSSFNHHLRSRELPSKLARGSRCSHQPIAETLRHIAVPECGHESLGRTAACRRLRHSAHSRLSRPSAWGTHKGRGYCGRASSRSAHRCTDRDPFHEMTPLRTA